MNRNQAGKDRLRNAQCHEVDPSAIKAADYDEQGQRIVQ